MKQKSESDDDIPELTEFEIRSAEFRYRPARADTAERRMLESQVTWRNTWAPLMMFRWIGVDLALTDDTHLRPAAAFRGFEERPEFHRFISDVEREDCHAIGHWLFVRQAAQDVLSVREKANAFLLALWMTRPTLTYIPLRFEESDDRRYCSAARILDRFRAVEPDGSEEIHDDELAAAAKLLTALRAVYLRRGRLRNALVLTFRACVSSEWQSSLICFAAATEALLTYSASGTIGDRLGHAAAALLCDADHDRPSIARRVKQLYRVRSKIIHGLAYDRSDAEQNLRDLAEAASLIRSIWGRVLRDERLQTVLEGEDATREAFFRSR